MGDGGRCREVVFLAQQAEEEGEPASVATLADRTVRPRTSWFNWRWAWIPVAACASLIGFAVIHHYRNAATETQTAVNVAPKDNLQPSASPKGNIQVAPPQNVLAPKQPAKSSNQVTEREAAPRNLRRDEADKFEEKRQGLEKGLGAQKSEDHKDVALAAASPAPSFAVSGGSMHSMMEARAKTSAIGGPLAANQLQQQSVANQQNSLNQSQNAELDVANKPGKEDGSLRSQSETVAVQAPAAAPTAPSAAPLAGQLNATPSSGQNELTAPTRLAGTRKKDSVLLPSGLGVLSVAKVAGRTIALDTKGALFLSEDDGAHWKAVRTQWTGRAVLVRGLGAAEKDKVAGVLKDSRTVKFELVTDGLQTWLSVEGDVWTLQPMPGK